MRLFKPKGKVVKEKLADFLSNEKAIEIMDSCVLKDDATWLNSQIKIEVTQSDKRKIQIRIQNNSKNGFTEFIKEYAI